MTHVGGLYIHIPFCKQKCGYCDFASFAGLENQIDIYLDGLEKEAAPYSGVRFDTLYVGGGTPSLLSVEQLQKLVYIIFNKIDKYSGRMSGSKPLENFSESTLEANPESLTAEKINFLKTNSFYEASF